MSIPILYEDLIANQVLGQHIDVFDKKMSDSWRSIFSLTPSDTENSAALRASISLALAMRALLSVVSPRPPGNVHARQKMTNFELLRLNDSICSKVICIHKEIKRERRYVEFEVLGQTTDDRKIYAAHMSLIWAA
jgi:hypothetical protein